MTSPKFPRTLQATDYTCAPCCVHAVLEYHNCGESLSAIKEGLGTTEDGTSSSAVVQFLRDRGFSASMRSWMTMSDLERVLARGVLIADVDGDHFAVVHAIDDTWVYISDPSLVRLPGRRQRRSTFRARWNRTGIVVVDPENGRPTHPMHVPLEVECPLTGDVIAAGPEDGTYQCPACGNDIEIDGAEAVHVELFVYRCPVTDARACIPFEDDEEDWDCVECGEPVSVVWHDGLWDVRHSVEYE